MNKFTYNPTITGNVIKTDSEQFDKFFYQGHPVFLIPDFNQNEEDIWLGYLDYLESKYGEIYDQDGGEITSHSVINTNTGLTKCVYTAYGIQIDGSKPPQDVTIEIEGYVVEIPPMTGNNLSTFEDYIFVATQVIENFNQ